MLNKILNRALLYDYKKGKIKMANKCIYYIKDKLVESPDMIFIIWKVNE